MTPPFGFSLNRTFFCIRRFSHAHFSSSPKDAINPRLDFLRHKLQGLEPSKSAAAPLTGRNRNPEGNDEKARSMEISHPWPEWVELMEHLIKRGYLDSESLRSSTSKDSNLIRTACLNFGRQNTELIRYLSRKDIRMIVESGCPNIDRKVVNSGKRLRAYVGTNEGEVCSSCRLRGNCERAYVKANKDENGRTLDVMRILLAYGLDAVDVEKRPNLNQNIKASLRKMLSDILNLSIKDYGSIPKDKRLRTVSSYGAGKTQISVPMKQGDWICPKCNFLNFAKNIKCLRCDGVFHERLAKLWEDQEHLPLKKGDWICEKCNFLNFAKNAKCLQCNEKPTNRVLNSGEWECASCNYINFRKNYFCRRCGWNRPKAECIVDSSPQPYWSNTEHNDKHSDTTFQQLEHQKIHQKEGKSVFQSFPNYIFCKHKGNDGDDEDGMRESENNVEFFDFPIVGGKSAISKDRLCRESWKEQMTTRKEGMVFEESFRKSCDEESSSTFETTASDESSGEDDMASWFRK